MSDHKPEKPYVTQPHPAIDMGGKNPYTRTGRLWAIAGMPYPAAISGLTRTEADAVCAALLKLEPPHAQ